MTIQELLQTKNITETANCGIYLIYSVSNNKVYVGQTKNFNRRKKQHFQELKVFKHRNSFLQNIYNKYGKDGLIFIPFLECEKQLLNKYELETAMSLNKEDLINLGVIGGSIETMSSDTKLKIGVANKGKKHTEEAKKKMSESRKGKKLPRRTEEQKKRMSEGMKGRIPWNKGIPMTEKSKEALLKSHLGKATSKEVREKISRTIKEKGIRPPINTNRDPSTGRYT